MEDYIPMRRPKHRPVCHCFDICDLDERGQRSDTIPALTSENTDPTMRRSTPNRSPPTTPWT